MGFVAASWHLTQWSNKGGTSWLSGWLLTSGPWVPFSGLWTWHRRSSYNYSRTKRNSEDNLLFSVQEDEENWIIDRMKCSYLCIFEDFFCWACQEVINTLCWNKKINKEMQLGECHKSLAGPISFQHPSVYVYIYIYIYIYNLYTYNLYTYI